MMCFLVLDFGFQIKCFFVLQTTLLCFPEKTFLMLLVNIAKSSVRVILLFIMYLLLSPLTVDNQLQTLSSVPLVKMQGYSHLP